MEAGGNSNAGGQNGIEKVLQIIYEGTKECFCKRQKEGKSGFDVLRANGLLTVVFEGTLEGDKKLNLVDNTMW